MASSQRIIIITALACLAAPINAAPTSVISQKIARASNSTGFLTENGIAAQQLNLQFASLQKSDSCTGKIYLLYATTMPSIHILQTTRKAASLDHSLNALMANGNSLHVELAPHASLCPSLTKLERAFRATPSQTHLRE